jgi:SAM-dependent methyltransferase
MQELGRGSFDMIVSNAVMEEIYDPTSALKAQGELLRPGGVLVHRIDLSDYGVFSKHGFNPLEFLTVPDWIYQRMVEDAGQPNRRLIDYYRNVGAQMGYDTEVHITQVLGSSTDLESPVRELRAGIDYTDRDQKLIAEIRPRLLDRYKKLPEADLLVRSIVFVARKPGAVGKAAN